jgi:hypothetical protein
VCDVTDRRLEEEEESAMASVSESRSVGEEDAVKSDAMTTSGPCSGSVETLVVLPATGSATLRIGLGLGPPLIGTERWGPPARSMAKRPRSKRGSRSKWPLVHLGGRLT